MITFGPLLVVEALLVLTTGALLAVPLLEEGLVVETTGAVFSEDLTTG